jgi:hypothetical protein
MRLPPRSRLLDAFEDIRWDPEEILDFGDSFSSRLGRGDTDRAAAWP